MSSQQQDLKNQLKELKKVCKKAKLEEIFESVWKEISEDLFGEEE